MSPQEQQEREIFTTRYAELKAEKKRIEAAIASSRKPIDNCEGKMTDTLIDLNAQFIDRVKADQSLVWIGDEYLFGPSTCWGISSWQLKTIAKHLIAECPLWQGDESRPTWLLDGQENAFERMEDGWTKWFPPQPLGTSYNPFELLAIADHLDEVNAPWEAMWDASVETLAEPSADDIPDF